MNAEKWIVCIFAQAETLLKIEENKRRVGMIQTPINRDLSRSAAMTFRIIISYFGRAGRIYDDGLSH